MGNVTIVSLSSLSHTTDVVNVLTNNWNTLTECNSLVAEADNSKLLGSNIQNNQYTTQCSSHVYVLNVMLIMHN